jgi:metal-responsive CopG/Arc/MetJ family transcriptional regulator
MVKALLSTTVEAEIYKKLDEYSRKKGIPKSKIIEEALKEYFEKHK